MIKMEYLLEPLITKYKKLEQQKETLRNFFCPGQLDYTSGNLSTAIMTEIRHIDDRLKELSVAITRAYVMVTLGLWKNVSDVLDKDIIDGLVDKEYGMDVRIGFLLSDDKEVSAKSDLSTQLW